MVCPCLTLTSGVQKLQDLAQKLQDLAQKTHTSEEAQKEAKMSVQVAGLVSSCTLLW